LEPPAALTLGARLRRPANPRRAVAEAPHRGKGLDSLGNLRLY